VSELGSVSKFLQIALQNRATENSFDVREVLQAHFDLEKIKGEWRHTCTYFSFCKLQKSIFLALPCNEKKTFCLQQVGSFREYGEDDSRAPFFRTPKVAKQCMLRIRFH